MDLFWPEVQVLWKFTGILADAALDIYCNHHSKKAGTDCDLATACNMCKIGHNHSSLHGRDSARRNPHFLIMKLEWKHWYCAVILYSDSSAENQWNWPFNEKTLFKQLKIISELHQTKKIIHFLFHHVWGFYTG